MSHVVNLVKSKVREAIKRSPFSKRSNKWSTVEKLKKAQNPTCECCGSTKQLQVHHKLPFHLHPELELDMDNLITLCMDKNDCHLKVGHGGYFKAYNPNLMKDISEIRSGLISLSVVWIKAKANRKIE